MESARKYTSVRMEAYSFGTYKKTGNIESTGNGENDNAEAEKSSENKTGSLWDSMEDLMNRYEQTKVRSVSSTKKEQDAIANIRMRCLQYLLRILFGSKSKRDVLSDEDIVTELQGQNSQSVSTSVSSYTKIDYYGEAEETAFSTEGTVVTADGRELSFNLSLEMSRSFEAYYSESYEIEQDLCDPLVINLDTDIAEVSDQKFMFDIDADGITDEISKLDAASGYLALDVNGDGEINDGSELFGTKSGDGFKDLSAYDSDENGWIDEADEIWDRLLIYTQDEEGNSVTYGLSEKGVGAICLKNVDTEYSLTNASENQVNAVIRKTGIFLYENGNVGTVQHLDIAK